MDATRVLPCVSVVSALGGRGVDWQPNPNAGGDRASCVSDGNNRIPTPRRLGNWLW